MALSQLDPPGAELRLQSSHCQYCQHKKLFLGLVVCYLVAPMQYVDLPRQFTYDGMHNKKDAFHDNIGVSTTQRERSIQISNCTLTPPTDPAAVPEFYLDSLCAKMLLSNILGNTSCEHDDEDCNHDNILPRRWLMFGDSTIGHLFRKSLRPLLIQGPQLQQLWMSQVLGTTDLAEMTTTKQKHNNANNSLSLPMLKCANHKHRRCRLNEYFQFPPIQRNQRQRQLGGNLTWQPPDPAKGEGPTGMGALSPNCQDCAGCNSEYTICELLKNQNNESKQHNTNQTIPNHIAKLQIPSLARTTYGGYFSIEFARDVEIQTYEYKTTQENVLNIFVQTHYNSQYFHGDDHHTSIFMKTGDLFGGPPICVVSSGIHDMTIKSNTNKTGADLNIYLSNVRQYMALLQRQCSHIVWVTNTAPIRKNDEDPWKMQYVQTQERTEEWNKKTQDLLINWNSTLDYTKDMHGNNNKSVLQSITIVDVFEASKKWQHMANGNDNIHLIRPWYKALGLFFVYIHSQIIQSTVATKQLQPQHSKYRGE